MACQGQRLRFAAYKEKKNATIKHDHNELLACLFLAHCPARQGPARALAYDGGRMETSRCWADRLACRRVRIRVVERNTRQAAHMANMAPHGTRVTAATAHSFLKAMKCGTRFNLAYMDCMGTIAGNKATADYPLEDLKLLLQHAADTLIIGLTFCARLAIQRRTRHASVCRTIMVRYLLPAIHMAGYTVKHQAAAHCYRRTGGAPMAFFALVLTRK
jgi:hypothetical protein